MKKENMREEHDILKIVKEDILRILGEEKGNIVLLKSIKPEIKASELFILKAVKELKRKGLIQFKGNIISLTKEGLNNAKEIVRTHLIIEKYLKESKSEKEAHQKAHILEHYISEEIINNIKMLSTLKKDSIPLTNLFPNEQGIVSDFTFSDYGLFERIVSMGIFLGEKIGLISEIPNGVIVEIKNKKFALGKDIAKEISVIKDGNI